MPLDVVGHFRARFWTKILSLEFDNLYSQLSLSHSYLLDILDQNAVLDLSLII